MDVLPTGSTTFRRADLKRGFEPDGSFYFSENGKRVRGKDDIDLDAGDPSPTTGEAWSWLLFSASRPPAWRHRRLTNAARRSGQPDRPEGAKRRAGAQAAPAPAVCLAIQPT